jgi:hypothetical protein
MPKHNLALLHCWQGIDTAGIDTTTKAPYLSLVRREIRTANEGGFQMIEVVNQETGEKRFYRLRRAGTIEPQEALRLAARLAHETSGGHPLTYEKETSTGIRKGQWLAVRAT